jgi:predicted amidohydrolase
MRVAAVQMTSTDDVPRNLAEASRLVREAAGRGADLIGLPENFAFLGAGGGGDHDHRLGLAEPLDDHESGGSRDDHQAPGSATPIFGAMRDLARAVGRYLLLGGFPERSRRGDRIHNTAVLLDPEGAVAARYRKVHLFDVDLAGGTRFRESDAVEAGAEPVVAALPWGGLGLSVCYDLRFPELYRRLAAAGARVLAVPSAFTAETGKDHWHVLLRARAVENQAFVLAPAQFGHHGGARRSYGHALVVDPWGTVLAECGDHPGLAVADLDFDYQDQVRARFPALRHRKL